MRFDKFTTKFQQAFADAQSAAVGGDHAYIEPQHLLLALITLGEGWHNNHHHCQSSCRQGIYWWEIDITYLTLLVLAKLGLVWDLRPVPAKVYAQAAGARRPSRPT